MEIFTLYYPQPVDIALEEYLADKDNVDAIALQNGYKYVGVNGNKVRRAVFSTKGIDNVQE